MKRASLRKLLLIGFRSVVSYNTLEIPIFTLDSVNSAPKIGVYDSLDADVLQSYMEYSLASLIFYALREGACSEQSARMTAMENASKNAGKYLEVKKIPSWINPHFPSFGFGFSPNFLFWGKFSANVRGHFSSDLGEAFKYCYFEHFLKSFFLGGGCLCDRRAKGELEMGPVAAARPSLDHYFFYIESKQRDHSCLKSLRDRGMHDKSFLQRQSKSIMICNHHTQGLKRNYH